jgi:hypothetical protein
VKRHRGDLIFAVEGEGIPTAISFVVLSSSHSTILWLKKGRLSEAWAGHGLFSKCPWWFQYLSVAVYCSGNEPSEHLFSHGQLYSAMTRVPDAANVLILKYEGDLSTCTANIVWEELLL